MARDELTIGNRYRQLALLGEGSMGAVYRALDRLTGEMVALKRVAVSPGQLCFASRTDQDSTLALAQEFETLASLRHPHIIAVRDYGFDANRRPFFTMDLLDTPRTILEAGLGQPPETQAKLLLQMLHALAYLHRRSILHRDLKPSNVLVTGGVVKVLDFGLSISRDQAVQSRSGSLAYMAPEVLCGEPATPAADLYAVGVIAYELLAGRHPFDTADLSTLIDQILETPPALVLTRIDSPVTAILERLLAKTPEERYPDAATVIRELSAATGQDLPVETAETRESFLQAARFVGREKELAQLSEALAQAVGRHGSAWLIGGESGVGKSRLVDELRTRALVQGATVLRGQAVSEGGRVYQLWREVIGWLVLLTEPTALEASVLKVLVPDINVLLEREVADAPELAPPAAQTRLRSVMSDLMRQAVVRQPLLILLEDVQWAEANSLDLLGRLNRLADESALLMVATYRQDEAPDLPARLADMQVMALPRLTEENVATLSASMLGVGGQQSHLVSFLHRETEGNVFFLVKVVRALAEEAGRLDGIAAMTLPLHVFAGGIQTIVQRRLQRVPADDQPLLQLAAVAGRQLDLDVLRGLAPATDLERWLTHCAGAAILDVRDERWRFAHDKLREGILAALPTDRRGALHQQVAQAIDQVHAADLSPHYADQAYHYGQAQDLEGERRYARLAGQQAADRFANEQALTYLTRALELTEPEDLAARYTLLLRREKVYDLEGHRQLQTQDLAALSGLADALANDLRRAQVGVRRAHYARVTGEYAAAIAAAQDAAALAQAGGDGALEAAGHLQWGMALLGQGDSATAIEHLERTRSLARAAQLPGLEAYSLIQLGAVSGFRKNDLVTAQAYFEQALRFYRETGDRSGQANALLNLGWSVTEQGDYASAQRHFEQALRLCREIGESRLEGFLLSNFAEIARRQGDWDSARAFFEQALRHARQIDDRKTAGLVLGNLGLLCYQRGDYAAARDWCQQALRLAQQIGDRLGQGYVLNTLGNILLDTGQPDLAADAYQQAVDVRREIDDFSVVNESLAGLARVALARGNRAQAQAWVDAILEYLSANTLGGAEEPIRIYLTCYHVLQSNHDPRAAASLEQAHALLQEQAARITDEARRRVFLENIPLHRAVVKAWAALTRAEEPAA